MKIFFKISIAIILLIAIWLYFYLRVNSKDVSGELPYSEVIGKELILDRDIFLYRKNTTDFYKTTSIVHNHDSYISSYSKETIVEVIKKGTRLTVNKATIQSHGESGTYGEITGVLHTEQYDIPFKQEWGRFTIYVFDDSEPKGDNTLPFTFEEPIWQSKLEHSTIKTYYFPEL